MSISPGYLNNPGYNKALLDSVKADVPSYAYADWNVGCTEMELSNIRDLTIGFQDGFIDPLGTSLLVYGASKASLYTIKARESYGWHTASQKSYVTISPNITSISITSNGRNILLGCGNSSYPRYLSKMADNESWVPDKLVDITTYGVDTYSVLGNNDNLNYLLGTSSSIYRVNRTSSDVEWTTSSRTVLTNATTVTCLTMGIDYLDFFGGSASYVYVFSRATNLTDWVGATRLTIPGTDTVGSWRKIIACKSGNQLIGIRSLSDSPYLITRLPGTLWSAATTKVVKMSSIPARVYSGIIPINEKQIMLLSSAGRCYVETINTLTHPVMMGTI